MELFNMRQVCRDNALQEAYQPVGHVKVTMLSREEVAAILAEIKTMRPQDKFAPLSPDGKDVRYHCSFLDSNKAYKAHVHKVISDFFEPHIDRVLKDFKILNCNFYVKAPHSGEFQIHQNWPAIADIEDTTVTVWCPLVDVVESNGGLQVVSGSHKLVPHVEGPSSPGFFNNFKQELIDKYLRPIPINAGDALIFDDSLIHWSARNDSDEPRIAIQILCVPKDAQPVYFFLEEPRGDWFELIEVDSHFFIHSDVKDLLTRQPHWKSVGFVANRNRLLTESEFAALLQNGERIRQQLDDAKVT
jgi:hypothetical protein